MHRFHVWTIGCQMNVAESAAITLALRKRGLRAVASMDEADLVILNSCTVRESAEQRVQGQLGLLARRKRQDPDLMIALTGCSVEPDLLAMEQKLPMVDFFFRPGALEHFLSQLEAREVIGLPLVQDPVMSYETPISTYVTVMQGCNKFCTYCIVPYRRGRERSRPIPEVVEDVTRFVQRGVREVTLLGQNIDSYGRDLPQRSHLAELLEAVDAVPGIERVRFMTSHPRDMDQRLIEAVAQLPHVCEQIHVAIQSGDDQVLRRMRRGYTGRVCVELVQRIRATGAGRRPLDRCDRGLPWRDRGTIPAYPGGACHLPLRQGPYRVLLPTRGNGIRDLAGRCSPGGQGGAAEAAGSAARSPGATAAGSIAQHDD